MNNERDNLTSPGTLTLSNTSSEVLEPRMPSLSSFNPEENPGLSYSTSTGQRTDGEATRTQEQPLDTVGIGRESQFIV